MSSSNCCFLICIQVSQETKLAWYSHLLKKFPQFVVIHTVKGFSIDNEAEVDVFMEFPCYFYDPMDIGNLISDSSAFSKTSLNISKLTVHILLKPGLENFENYFASMFSSVQFNRSVVSDSLRPFESQHTRPPCPSPTPGVHSNSRPSSQ